MSSLENIEIRKESGDLVSYDRNKLINSLKRAGADQDTAENIAAQVDNILFEGISTRDVYNKAFSLLRKRSKATAARYKLKKAIMELGESGYPFEKFIAALLEAEGYRTRVGNLFEGKCVSHEVDVLAEKNNTYLICECKFHNTQDRYSDVKVSLYIHSRYNDIVNTWKETPERKNKSYSGCIYTNTRFTSDALKYGLCAGLKMISWQHPNGNGIKDQIDNTGVHPVTCLTSLTKKLKKGLINKGVITCKDLVEQPGSLNGLVNTEKQKRDILEEAQAVCEGSN